ncbi:MAG: hypothetical protein K2K90_05995 [Lachnospiraceae bacterium]|nr:hypothetical protein [Lachnospiraceae bacterium]
MNSKRKFIKIVLIIVFLVILTKISFEKEWEYTDEELNARIISDTAPKVVKRGDEYTISIVVENTGGGVWTNEESIKLCIWQDGFDRGYRIDLPEDVQIEGGERYTFVLEGFSVQDKKSTKLEFQMIKEGVAYFGERKAASIKGR